jgi:hypothetical protein
MIPQEEAAMAYDGHEMDPSDTHSKLQGRISLDVQNRLLQLEGVTGVGSGRGPTGDDAIIVYVRRASDRVRIPKSVSGIPVITEVTGEIEPLAGP